MRLTIKNCVAGGAVGILVAHYGFDVIHHPDGTGEVPRPSNAAVVLASTATGGITGPVVVDATIGKLFSVLPVPDVRGPNVTLPTA